MADKLKEIQAKVMGWWNKFTSRQKTIIIGIGAVVIFAFAIFVYIFTRPQYTDLITCETTADAAEVINILEGEGITNRTSRDGLRIEVLNDDEQIAKANVALGAAGYAPEEWTIDDVTSGGFSTTEADKQKRYVKYLESKLEKDFSSQNAIKSARVTLNIPDQDGTLIAKEIESSAFIQLELEGDFTADNAAALARATATALHNETTANITIMDTDSNLLFSGEEDYTMAGVASSLLELRNQAETMVASQVKKVLLGTKQFDMIEVASNLDVDFSEYTKTVDEYYAPDGYEQGMILTEDTYESENSNSNGGVPGTDSNDETTQMYQDNAESSSSENERHVEYQPNHTSESWITPAGGVDYDNSSITITAIAYKTIREDDVKRQGLLDGISWEDYKLANNVKTKLEVDTEFYSAVSTATGIAEDKITILAYEEPLFYDAEGTEVSWTDVLSIAMLVVILALLAFVVLHSMRSKRVVNEEEELSVENLLQSTPESELEDIELENKSETRKMIEKFVDENPEAAANLLRNWLNEDWG